MASTIDLRNLTTKTTNKTTTEQTPQTKLTTSLQELHLRDAKPENGTTPTPIETKHSLRVNPPRHSKTLAIKKTAEEIQKWREAMVLAAKNQTTKRAPHLVLPKASRDQDGEDGPGDEKNQLNGWGNLDEDDDDDTEYQPSDADMSEDDDDVGDNDDDDDDDGAAVNEDEDQ